MVKQALGKICLNIENSNVQGKRINSAEHDGGLDPESDNKRRSTRDDCNSKLEQHDLTVKERLECNQNGFNIGASKKLRHEKRSPWVAELGDAFAMEIKQDESLSIKYGGRGRERPRSAPLGGERSIPVLKKPNNVISKKRPGHNRDGSKRVPYLLLDDALKNVNMVGWSDARKKAFSTLKENPNKYYYRFNKPGESQRTGAWNKEEHELFMRLLLEKGANWRWGLFSMSLPGRVGYQCQKYYRKMVKERKIYDPNWILDGNSLRFKRWRDELWVRYSFTVLEDASEVFGKPPAQHPKRPSGLDNPEKAAGSASRTVERDCSS